MSQEQEDTTIYRVVVNHEEQYSIWPEQRELPLGWKDAGKVGRKEECLAYINEVWTDMRPRSLREAEKENFSAQTPEGVNKPMGRGPAGNRREERERTGGQGPE